MFALNLLSRSLESYLSTECELFLTGQNITFDYLTILILNAH